MTADDVPNALIATTTAEGDVDRREIRKRRKAAAKAGKRIARARYDAVLGARPVGSQPANDILGRAAALYRNGPIAPRDLSAAVKQLRLGIGRDLPDHFAVFSPRCVSAAPRITGLMVYETRAITINGDQLVSALNHTVILEPDRITFVSGLLPGGTRLHLFERLYERDIRRPTMAEVTIRLSALWPTLLWMRAEQRRHGRGVPITVAMTPLEGGLLFGQIQRLDSMPPAGPTVAVVEPFGQKTREIHDFYADSTGARIWTMTNTYVDKALLGPDQRKLEASLRRFVNAYRDVVEANDWRWRFGLGTSDPAVATVARAFKITLPSDARFGAAFAALELIILSSAWQTVAAATEASQRAR